MITRFIIYGLLGWGMEILWTGLHSILQGNFKLTCSTSLWMFPIYGMAVFLEPIYQLLKDQPLALRGGIYMLCIFAAEFATGWSLQRVIGVCPWDYSQSKYNVMGVIRLDYAPVWFFVGLMFEWFYVHVILVF